MLRFFDREGARDKGHASWADFSSLHVSLDVKVSRHAEGAVLLHARRGVVFATNRVGAEIWQAIAAHASLDRVAESISRQFEVALDTAQRDMLAFVAQLERAELLVRCAKS